MTSLSYEEFLIVRPAYGADYHSNKEAKEAWLAGKDFQVMDMFHPDFQKYLSIRNLNDLPRGTIVLCHCDDNERIVELARKS